jgi:hypothetical protein
MTVGRDTHVRNSKTGRKKSALSPNADQPESAPKTYSELLNHLNQRQINRKRLSPEEIKARLILIIGATLALVFFVVTVGITYALIFVTQPVAAQAPNDAAFIDLLKTLAIFLTGSLGGVLASNGLKDKKEVKDTP